MPRKTPEELLEAKKKREAERRQEEKRRRLQEAEDAAAEERRQEELRQEKLRQADLHARERDLESYTTGIYNEAVKLSNKRATDDVSERMVDRANRAVHSARELLADENDPYIDEIEDLIAAGEPVEARDAVLTLRMVLDALDRMRRRHQSDWRFFQ